MEWIFDYAALIALFPLASFAIVLAFGRYLPKKGALVGILATGGSLVLSLAVAIPVAAGQTYHETIYTWMTGVAPEAITLTFGILIDPLAALMLVVVSLVAFLVHVFSLGYMNDEGETGLPRYYAELGLFTFSMLAFVFADNLLMAFIFFELVGLCSFLLIGFWFRDPAPPSAAKKAFLVTRFGDYFFLIGVIGVLVTFGSAQFAGPDAFPVLAQEAIAAGEPLFGMDATAWVTILGLLVLGGVVGKSAQFPLHTWLPDAMEGPTTVSALIHAATMVAAGVYLVARMFGFYALSPTLLGIIAFVGAFTALFAATMGVVNDDIKVVLAYSTISQYGYMMLGLGVAGYVAGVFHLMNHAFFKALLFLGAGSVIVATHHTKDMWKMGGLKSKLPVTYWTFLVGSLALAGIIPFSGFWSKDEILYDALIVGVNEPVILIAYVMALLAVFLTGFYTFRMVFLTFHGEPRSDHAADPHPVRWNIKGPLVVLGVLAAGAGLLNMAPVAKLTGLDIEFLARWLDGPIEETAYSTYIAVAGEFAGYQFADIAPLLPAVVALALALGGAGLAWRLYAVPEPARHTERLGPVGRIVRNNYYLDEFQVWVAEGLTAGVARVSNTFDQGVIDGIVNGIGSLTLFGGRRVRRLQTGIVTNYAALIAVSLVILLVAFAIYGGWF